MELNKKDKERQNTLASSRAHYVNILCCGDDYWDVLKLKKEELTIINGFCKALHPTYKWNYYLYEGMNEEIATKIKEQITANVATNNDKNLNNILICKLDKDTEANIDFLITELIKLGYSHPMMILIVEGKEAVSSMQDFIKSKQYLIDSRDIFVVNCFNNNPKPLYKCIYSICSYYNQLGDHYDFPFKLPKEERLFQKNEVSFLYKLNIMLVGQLASGKSAFLNQIFESKRAFERITKRGTNRVTCYQHDEYPLAFYDTPGLTSIGERDELFRLLTAYQANLKSNKENLLLVLYFIDGLSGSFKPEEASFIQKCSQLPIIFWFVISNCNTEANCQEKEKSISSDLITMGLSTPKVFAVNNKPPLYGYSKLLIEMYAIVSRTFNSKDKMVFLIAERKANFIIEAAIRVAYFLEIYINREVAYYYMMVSKSLKDDSLISKAKMVKTICSFYLMDITIEDAYKLMDTFNWVKTLKELSTEIHINRTNDLALDVDWIYKALISIDNKGMIDEGVFKGLYSRAIPYFSDLIKENKRSSLQVIALNVIALCIVACWTNTYCNRSLANSETFDKMITEDMSNARNSLRKLGEKFQIKH